MTQCWTIRDNIQWKRNENSYIFIQENAFESVVCETASILSRPQCVNVETGQNGADNIFQMPFLYENVWIWIKEVCSLGSNYQYFSIGSDNGLTPSTRQAIMWTNDG